MTPEERRKLNYVYETLKKLESSSTIPLSIDQAFRRRFLEGNDEFVDGGDGGAVNVNTYNSFNVDVPVVSGKRKIVIEGVTYNFLYQ